MTTIATAINSSPGYMDSPQKFGKARSIYKYPMPGHSKTTSRAIVICQKPTSTSEKLVMMYGRVGRRMYLCINCRSESPLAFAKST